MVDKTVVTEREYVGAMAHIRELNGARGVNVERRGARMFMWGSNGGVDWEYEFDLGMVLKLMGDELGADVLMLDGISGLEPTVV